MGPTQSNRSLSYNATWCVFWKFGATDSMFVIVLDESSFLALFLYKVGKSIFKCFSRHPHPSVNVMECAHVDFYSVGARLWCMGSTVPCSSDYVIVETVNVGDLMWDGDTFGRNSWSSTIISYRQSHTSNITRDEDCKVLHLLPCTTVTKKRTQPLLRTLSECFVDAPNPCCKQPGL